MSHMNESRQTCVRVLSHMSRHTSNVSKRFFFFGGSCHTCQYTPGTCRKVLIFFGGPVTHVKTHLEGVKEFCATEGKVFHHVRQPLLVIRLVDTPYVDHKAQLYIHVLESVKGRGRG